MARGYRRLRSALAENVSSAAEPFRLHLPHTRIPLPAYIHSPSLARSAVSRWPHVPSTTSPVVRSARLSTYPLLPVDACPQLRLAHLYTAPSAAKVSVNSLSSPTLAWSTSPPSLATRSHPTEHSTSSSATESFSSSSSSTLTGTGYKAAAAPFVRFSLTAYTYSRHSPLSIHNASRGSTNTSSMRPTPASRPSARCLHYTLPPIHARGRIIDIVPLPPSRLAKADRHPSTLDSEARLVGEPVGIAHVLRVSQDISMQDPGSSYFPSLAGRSRRLKDAVRGCEA
ncbi:hypothetical protein C8F01DRAFT_45672 [Mycena amicta]|nr:hypothetical protein C8F01DRAFT_45672 [Mycena amicta]